MAIKLGLDAKRAFNNHSGLGVYSRGLITYLEIEFSIQDLVLFTPRKKIWHSSFTTITNRFGAIWRSFFIYFDLLKYDIEVYHGLAGELPFFIPKNVKTVVTIHDLLFLHFPSDYPWIDRIIYNLKSKSACYRADRIIAISQVTKNDIINHYQISPEKIEVISPAIPEFPLISEQRPIINEYIVCISSFLGRKNQDILIQAFEKIAEIVSFDLVFIGSGKRLNQVKELALKSNHSNRIHFLSRIGDTEKFTYLKHCLFSVYPSLGEGFGIPIIESFSMNKPIILSDTPIHREVAGEAGIYFKSNSIDDLSEKLLAVNSNLSYTDNTTMQSKLQGYDGNAIYQKIINIYFSLRD